MEEYLKKRPPKKVFLKEEIDRLRSQAVGKIKSKLLPNEKIIKIILIGSSIKNSFGEYDPPGFRGSLFSDFDFIVFIEDDYQIPRWLNKESEGKPFPDNSINLAYRNKFFIDEKYDIEVFFLKRTNFENPITQEQGELAGIPMTNNTTHKNFVVYDKMTV